MKYLIFAVLLVGCGTQPQEIHCTSWEKKPLDEPCRSSIVELGPQSILCTHPQHALEVTQHTDKDYVVCKCVAPSSSMSR